VSNSQDEYNKLLKELIKSVNNVVKSAIGNKDVLCNIAGIFIAAATDAMIRAGMDKDRVLATMRTIIESYIPKEEN